MTDAEPEIHSFNGLFVEAQKRGVRLNNFAQLENGVFRANWRHEGDGIVKMFGPHVDHERPFDAVRDAFLALLPAIAGYKPQRTVTPASDLFDAPEPTRAPSVTSDLFG